MRKHTVTKTRKLCTGAAQGTPEAQSLIRMPIQSNALYVYSQLNKIYILFNLDCTKKMLPFLPGPVNDKSTGSIFSPVLLPLAIFSRLW